MTKRNTNRRHRRRSPSSRQQTRDVIEALVKKKSATRRNAPAASPVFETDDGQTAVPEVPAAHTSSDGRFVLRELDGFYRCFRKQNDGRLIPAHGPFANEADGLRHMELFHS